MEIDGSEQKHVKQITGEKDGVDSICLFLDPLQPSGSKVRIGDQESFHMIWMTVME
jgi:hypothetical protein